MNMELEKYHGLGNDYLVYDPQNAPFLFSEEQIRRICDRNFGVGSDGILYGPLFEEDKLKVRIFNPDGSEAEKSGNGVRIFSKYLKDAGYVTGDRFVLTTLGGDVKVEYLNESGDLLKVEMGTVTYESGKIPVTGENRQVIDETMRFGNQEYRVTCLSIGNPHCVIPMEEISREKACNLGPLVENSKHFPNRINMQLLKILDRDTIQIEIYERGAGYTLASGSSSCAAASAAYKLGLVGRQVDVRMPGGSLRIEISPDENVYMTGSVNIIGTVTLSPVFIKELNMLE